MALVLNIMLRHKNVTRLQKIGVYKMFDKIMTIIVLTLSVATITYLLPDMLYYSAPIHLIAYTLAVVLLQAGYRSIVKGK